MRYRPTVFLVLNKADIISPLCSPDSGRLLDLSSVQQYIPIKQLSDLPVSYEHGGGLFSEPDWSRPFRAVPDTFQSLRRQWVKLLLNNGLIQKMKSFFNSGDAQPPFTEDDLIPFKNTLNEFIQSHGLVPDWSIRADQPMQLSIMAALSRILDDRDTTLFPMLLAGAPTGFDGDIPALVVFPTQKIRVMKRYLCQCIQPTGSLQNLICLLHATLSSKNWKRAGFTNMMALWKMLNKNLVTNLPLGS